MTQSSGRRSQGYHAVLGVSQTASLDEIKTAYRQLARQYHPDLNPGCREAEERFKEINAAYVDLSSRSPGVKPTYTAHRATSQVPQGSSVKEGDRNAVYELFMNGLGGKRR
jgi:molecular chaperone DnaJ